jgi:probable F420-dependent oxidoreductase
MGDVETSLRQRLGRVGVWSWAPAGVPAAEVREAIAEIEALGFPAIWYPEAVGRESFTAAALLLSSSERIAVCSGIASIYARDATAMVNGARALGEAYQGRFVLGIGVSHKPPVTGRGHEYLPPVPTMRAYLDAMESAHYVGPQPPEPVPVVLAALGPLMLKLAAERTSGAHPYFTTVEHTAIARERLGPAPVLAPEIAVVLTRDRGEAREAAAAYMSLYLGAENYRNHLFRLGFTEDDLAGAGSDRVFEAVVAWGDVDAIRARVQAHLDAGADHVGVQVVPSGSFHLETVRELAPALLEL